MKLQFVLFRLQVWKLAVFAMSHQSRTTGAARPSVAASDQSFPAREAGPVDRDRAGLQQLTAERHMADARGEETPPCSSHSAPP